MVLIKKMFLVCTIMILVLGLNLTNQAFGENIVLKDLQGNNVNLESYQGRPRLFVFWTTWCPYCRKAIQSLTQMNSQLQKDGVLVLAVNVNESRSKVERFFKNLPFNFKVLLDQNALLASSYNVNGVPTYVLINAANEIVEKVNSFPANYKVLLNK